MNHEAYLLQKYDGRLTLTLKELAEELGMAVASIHNAIAAGRFRIETSLDVAGRRVAHISRVAAYYDQLLSSAQGPAPTTSTPATASARRPRASKKAADFTAKFRAETQALLKAQGMQP